MTFMKLLGATAIGVVDVSLNFSFGRLLRSAQTAHWLRLSWRYDRRVVDRQVELLGKGVWFYAAPQFACLLLTSYAARTAMSPLLLGFVLVFALVVNIHVILPEIVRITAVGGWLAAPATKCFIYSVPLVLAYEGRPAGANWVSDLFRMRATNFSLAWSAARRARSHPSIRPSHSAACSCRRSRSNTTPCRLIAAKFLRTNCPRRRSKAG